jgi:uncharacterized protein YciI
MRAVALALMILAGLAWTGAAHASAMWLVELRLSPTAGDPERWSANQKALVDTHFARLKALHGTGRAWLVGRSNPMDERALGLVFVRGSEAEARDLVAGDPAVAAGLLTARVHAFTILLGPTP